MPEKVFTIYKVCRVCDGKKQVEVTFLDGSKQVLQCASCMGRGNFIWGYMVDDGQADQYITS
jgi:hypothetical protein